MKNQFSEKIEFLSWGKISASVFISFFSFLYSGINGKDLYYVFLDTINIYKELINFNSINNIPLEIPVFILWFFVGIIVYFSYFLLQNIYNYIENYIKIKATFVAPSDFNNSQEDKNFKIHAFLKVFIHFSIIIFYVLSFFIFYYFLMPACESLRNYFFNYINSFLKIQLLAFYLSFISSFIFWLNSLNILDYLRLFLVSAVKIEDFKEKHNYYIK